ncbi:MAG: hypothetical protein L3K01_05310 [Thermoplasmata archaeon]|nr:hypothetical protein [Thermoplasmata archaeon]
MTDKPLVGRPVLVPGAASAAILGADGSFSLPWDTRGAPLEWGGVYAQGVRLTGPWTVAVGPRESPTLLGPATLRSFRHWRWGTEAVHEVPGFAVVDELLPLEELPGIGRRLTVRRNGSGSGPVRVDGAVRPSLGHVLVEGIQPHEYDLVRRGPTLRVHAFGSALAWDSDPLPTSVMLDGRPWTGGDVSGPLPSVESRHELPLPSGGAATLSWVLWGGRLATIVAAPDAGRLWLEKAGSWRGRAEGTWTEWEKAVPRLELPDSPGLAEGFRLATGALRALYSSPDPGMTGLVAGYPWYSALWFRDIAWMLPAVLWLGDVERVKATVATAFHYQAPEDLDLLAAKKGELPMQLSPGPIFLYGTSDTTLYYPGILRRLVRHTGDFETARPYRPGLDRIYEWAIRKVDPDSGLLSNGGEVAALDGVAHEVGHVQFGITALDTTIWDSTDRRDHAIDVQVLWQEALDALADLTGEHDEGRARDLRARAEAVRTAIATRYRWPEQRYLYDSLLRDGSPVRQVRPNALRAVEAGLFDPATSRTLLDRAGQNDLSTPWGVRTLSSEDGSYDPIAYHDGQVWTIATAWAAAAEFRAGTSEAAVGYLETIAARIRAEGGYANECYRGDGPTPFNSCFLLGFSVAPFLTSIFEGLWGLEPRMTEQTIRCRPNFPAHWTSASLRNLRLGPGTLELAWKPGTLQAVWTGPWPVVLAGVHASVHLVPGEPATLPLGAATSG